MRETEPRVAILNNSAENLQLIVRICTGRYSGVTRDHRMVAPKLAQLFRAGWFGSDAPDGIARIAVADLARLWAVAHAADLARAAQQRDDRGRVVAIARPGP